MNNSSCKQHISTVFDLIIINESTVIPWYKNCTIVLYHYILYHNISHTTIIVASLEHAQETYMHAWSHAKIQLFMKVCKATPTCWNSAVACRLV